MTKLLDEAVRRLPPEMQDEIARGRFPYGLFFRPLEDAIYVIARFHSRRDPVIWQRRI